MRPSPTTINMRRPYENSPDAGIAGSVRLPRRLPVRVVRHRRKPGAVEPGVEERPEVLPSDPGGQRDEVRSTGCAVVVALHPCAFDGLEGPRADLLLQGVESQCSALV